MTAMTDLRGKTIHTYNNEQLKRVAQKLNVKMSNAAGSPRTKQGLWQAIKAAKKGHGAIRHQCRKHPRGSPYCRKPGSPLRKSKSPKKKTTKRK